LEDNILYYDKGREYDDDEEIEDDDDADCYCD
jgi:hypothetical protein